MKSSGTPPKGWRGYIGTRKMAGHVIPQRLQNLVIRTYAQNRGLFFLLSATEYEMDNCYMMLHSVFDELDTIEGILFYSLDLLPADVHQRKLVFEKVFEKNRSVHFALEELVVSSWKDVAVIEDILLVKDLSRQVRIAL